MRLLKFNDVGGLTEIVLGSRPGKEYISAARKMAPIRNALPRKKVTAKKAGGRPIQAPRELVGTMILIAKAKGKIRALTEAFRKLTNIGAIIRKI